MLLRLLEPIQYFNKWIGIHLRRCNGILLSVCFFHLTSLFHPQKHARLRRQRWRESSVFSFMTGQRGKASCYSVTKWLESLHCVCERDIENICKHIRNMYEKTFMKTSERSHVNILPGGKSPKEQRRNAAKKTLPEITGRNAERRSHTSSCRSVDSWAILIRSYN